MTIADLIKYIDFLKQRSSTLQNTIHRFETLKTTSRVVAVNADQKVEEISTPTVAVSELLSEFDVNAKELRLAQTELEKLNHTTHTDFTAKY